jgi:ribosomal protein L17
MLNGMQMLDGVDERLRRSESEAAAAQAELDGLIARRDQARAAEVAALRTLARVRFGELRSGSAELERLDGADARAQALLEEQRKAIAAADEQMTAQLSVLGVAKVEREKHADALRAVEAKAEQALSAAHDAVLADPEWQRLREAAEATRRMAEHADHKAQFAMQDSTVKGQPYLADPLFSYLWKRHFGTPQYRAGFVVRLIDGWVAHVTRFEPARRDYAMLTDLPRQLAAHAARMHEAADAAEAEVANQARHVAGLPPANEVAALRHALEEADTKLETARTAAEAVQNQRATLAAGDDGVTREAVSALEAALGQTSLQSLRTAAARTPTLEDDAIVTTLEQASAIRVEADRLIAERRTEVHAARQRVQDLRQVRQEMAQQGYGQGRWNFSDGAMLGLLLGQLGRGALSRGSFWDRLNQQRLPDPWNGGSWTGGQQATGQRRSAWTQPPLSNPWGQPGMTGRSGGFGGGGFRTGGTMGGGGFRTGGSI